MNRSNLAPLCVATYSSWLSDHHGTLSSGKTRDHGGLLLNLFQRLKALERIKHSSRRAVYIMGSGDGNVFNVCLRLLLVSMSFGGDVVSHRICAYSGSRAAGFFSSSDHDRAFQAGSMALVVLSRCSTCARTEPSSPVGSPCYYLLLRQPCLVVPAVARERMPAYMDVHLPLSICIRWSHFALVPDVVMFL